MNLESVTKFTEFIKRFFNVNYFNKRWALKRPLGINGRAVLAGRVKKTKMVKFFVKLSSYEML